MGDQVGEQARLAAERGVIALLHDAPAVHHPNLVVVFGTFQLMRHQQGGLPVRGGVQRLHHPPFAVGVQAGGRLIEQQQPARADQRARHRHALRLADRQARGVVADLGLQPLRQERQQFADVRLFHRLLQLRFAGLRVAQQNIGAQRLRRQVRILPDPAQLAAPVFGGQLAQFDAVYLQRAAIGQEAEQQVQQRAFTGAAQPDQRDALAGLQPKAQRAGQQRAVGRQDLQIARLQRQRRIGGQRLRAVAHLFAFGVEEGFQRFRRADRLRLAW